VTDVDPSGPAAESGIHHDDVILEVNHQAVTSSREPERRKAARTSALSTAADGICFLPLRRVDRGRGCLTYVGSGFPLPVLMVLASLAGMGRLVATGQAATFDGLFLFVDYIGRCWTRRLLARPYA
jgi:hypothetical protein